MTRNSTFRKLNKLQIHKEIEHTEVASVRQQPHTNKNVSYLLYTYLLKSGSENKTLSIYFFFLANEFA